jgi:hypothetical protein
MLLYCATFSGYSTIFSGHTILCYIDIRNCNGHTIFSIYQWLYKKGITVPNLASTSQKSPARVLSFEANQPVHWHIMVAPQIAIVVPGELGVQNCFWYLREGTGRQDLSFNRLVFDSIDKSQIVETLTLVSEQGGKILPACEG